MIAIVDYGMGNLRSVQKAFEKLGLPAIITRDAGLMASASRLVLPGVGAFGLCMERLRGYGLVEPIKDFIAGGKPFLGICLGLQLLFEESEEFGRQEGLGVLKGKVKRFSAPGIKVPHMGWNNVKIVGPSPLFDGIADGSHFYFVHSFYVEPAEPVATGETEYGGTFVSAIQKGNVYATQFHPEKSQSAGLKMLENFARAASPA
ncbi:MAG: imidazole glycerol phosphate synthase subunit HisH [Nitrospinae bacterium]|nr:imidazole glycerol phosphate synthase subunit HisH [Nitrospinota bacterium]